MIVSCTSVNTNLVCSQLRKSDIKAMPWYDVSFKKNRCRVRCFDIDSYKRVSDGMCGDDFRSGNYPLEKCEGVGGYKDKSWAREAKPKIKKRRNLFGNLCGE
tara:strand:- start:766 stop:1071 length:306 start_codon:yes stop_codon:yes gene_type:complete